MIDVESVLAPDDRMKNTGPRFRPSPTARFISGTGYLAGSYPDGITTVEGVPVDATVRVLLRSTDPALDGLVMAETRSRQDGTWLIEGLNSGLRYDVIGRRDGFNDVIMANVAPMTD